MQQVSLLSCRQIKLAIISTTKTRLFGAGNPLLTCETKDRTFGCGLLFILVLCLLIVLVEVKCLIIFSGANLSLLVTYEKCVCIKGFLGGEKMPFLEMSQNCENDTLTVCLVGSLDSITSPELAECLKSSIGDASKLVLDFSELEYISSAGLRVVRGASKAMGASENMMVVGCNETVREVFEITGFIDVINVV